MERFKGFSDDRDCTITETAVSSGSGTNEGLRDYDSLDGSPGTSGRRGNENGVNIDISWDTASEAQKEIFGNKENFKEYTRFRRMRSRERDNSVSYKSLYLEQSGQLILIFRILVFFGFETGRGDVPFRITGAIRCELYSYGWINTVK